jgi:hypothetical protein
VATLRRLRRRACVRCRVAPKAVEQYTRNHYDDTLCVGLNCCVKFQVIGAAVHVEEAILFEQSGAM